MKENQQNFKEENFIELKNISLNLKETLFCGQIFHFKEIEHNKLYGGVLNVTLIILKQIDDKRIAFLYDEEGLHCHLSLIKLNQMIKKFLNIDIIVIKEDNHFKINELIINDDLICKVFDKHHQSCRFITNDLYSAIFSFICSQNNNIQRITKLVSFIYSLGEPIKYKNITFNKFPKLDKLFDFDLLKDKKFDYRARYVVDAAKFLNETPVDNNNISDLLRIKGVGRKVFDCICLTSLRRFHLVPIDIHVFKWSKVFFKLSFNSLTQKNYQQIQREWSNKFGRYAGIVQLFIFKESTLK